MKRKGEQNYEKIRCREYDDVYVYARSQYVYGFLRSDSRYVLHPRYKLLRRIRDVRTACVY